MENTERKGTMIAGLAAGGCIVTGAAGLVFTAMALIAGQFTAAGVLLIAAALAFGLLAVGVLE